MNVENIKLWIAALRSGEYQQGTGFLNPEGKYCCLGVACEVAEKHNIPVERRLGTLYGKTLSSYQLRVLDWLNLSTEIENILTTMNDTHMKTFLEIADYLESLIKVQG